MKTVVIIGGGAAGIFAAISCAAQHPSCKVIVLEKTRQLLSKVRISGGGRCNVTHAAFDPKVLIQNYPRGSKELLGPFHRFGPKETIQWFEERGVELKTEEDGRMFPITDNSQTIIDCLLAEAKKLHVDIRLEQHILSIHKKNELFEISFENQPPLSANAIVLATGSHPQGYAFAQSLGHTLVPSVPSLFTFNIPSSPLHDLAGISFTDIKITLKNFGLSQRGPLLITHWGFSGPAVLKLSAWAARELHSCDYKTDLLINWLPQMTTDAIFAFLLDIKKEQPNKYLENMSLFPLPNNFWKRVLQIVAIPAQTPIAKLSHKQIRSLSEKLSMDLYLIEGKTTYKQEFVTCGGVLLKEVDFKTMQSRLCPSLYFAGEILDIDGVTGGFNFQNAWTTGWTAGTHMFPSAL